MTSDGRTLTWAVADGTRGRRWRATIAAAAAAPAIEASLLLEASPDGRPTRLELATPAGLLTLHPEPGGGLHGNAVTADGVAHIAIPWTADDGIEVDGLTVPAAVTAARLSRDLSVGEGRLVRVAVVAVDLTVRTERRRYERLAALTWAIAGDAGELRLTIDARGVPVWPGVAAEWPLELGPEG